MAKEPPNPRPKIKTLGDLRSALEEVEEMPDSTLLVTIDNRGDICPIILEVAGFKFFAPATAGHRKRFRTTFEFPETEHLPDATEDIVVLCPIDP